MPARWWRRLRDARGFTILELLVATTVLSIGLIGAARAFPTGYGTVKASGSLTEGTGYAQRRMEELRSSAQVNFGGLTSGSETQGNYTITWTVAVTGTTPSQYATVTVTVSWPGMAKNSVDVVSVIAE